MQRLQAYRFELMPNGEQQRDMCRFAGACRFAYNKALAMQKDNHEAGQKFIGYVAMAKHLTGWRNGQETPWLKDAPCHPLQHALKDLEKAFKHFFAQRAGFPRFKRKGGGDTFRYPDPKQIKLDQANDRLFLPKLGWLRYRNSRDTQGALRNVTVSQSGGKWFVSIQTQRELDQALPSAATAVGIDVGIARFATLSDASFIAPINSFKKHQQRLARYQRRLSRKVKFSSNWKKAKAKVQQIWNGGTLLAVPPHHTSQECPCCGPIAKENRPTQAKFPCVDCGYENHADVVGAINVLERGYRLFACGEPVPSGRSMKQEPTEATRQEHALA